jgi:ParB family chromosome partitioning protein
MKLPLTSIHIENRQRIDLGDIAELADSLRSLGQIHPILVTPLSSPLNGKTHRLVAGERRYRAAESLGWPEIDVTTRENLSPDELHELELEENIRRKDMAWQERCLNILTIHELRQKKAVLASDTWGQRETGKMLGLDFGHINYLLHIARKLRSEMKPDKSLVDQPRYWSCASMSEAWSLRLRDEEDALNAELAKRQQDVLEIDPQLAQFVQAVEASLDALAEERARYEANKLNTVPFDEYWAEKKRLAEEYQNTLVLSNRILQGDSIAYMLDEQNAGRFDHIITDIPYGIDMDNLNQQNPHGQMVDIDTVEELHDVEYNKDLIARFYPAAFKCTKDKAFVITWADQMLWQHMYDCAIKAGFAVQRWPITWVKTSQCMNQCVTFNTTKDTEIAIVARKRGTTLAWQPQTSVITCGKDELCEAINHPFAKPYAIWERLVGLASLEGQTILEPFAGRGSGVISMLRMKRNVVGVELDVAHYNALLENVKQYYLSINPQFTFR